MIKRLFSILPVFSIYVHASYCIYVDEYYLNTTNTPKINEVLGDVAYPSFKVEDNKAYLYSGDFKSYSDAEKMLQLLKLKYKNAVVKSCKGTKKYLTGMELQEKDTYAQKKNTTYFRPYCLKIISFPLSDSTKEKTKINYILNKFPDTESKVENDMFIIYSGRFKTLKSAQTVAEIIKEEFPSTVAMRCVKEQGVQRAFYRNVPLKTTPRKFSNIDIKEEYMDIAVPKKSYANVDFYSLQVFKEKINNSNTQENKINDILTILPRAYVKKNYGNVTVVSGKFDTLDNAKIMAGVLKKDFPSITIIPHSKIQEKKVIQKTNQYTRTVEQKAPPSNYKTQPRYARSQYISPPYQERSIVREDSISIFDLDHSGYISEDVKSYKSLELSNRENYVEGDFNRYDDSVKNYLNGLYLRFNTAYDAKNSNIAYDTRIEYDLFKEGYFENKKKKEKNKIDHKLKFLKTMKSIYSLTKDKELLKIDTYSNSIVVSNLLLNLRFVESFFHGARRKLELGYITKHEYRQYSMVLKKIQNALYMYNKKDLLKLPSNIWYIVNQIEHISLMESEKLLYILANNSIDIKTTDTLQKKSLLTERWTDKLKVNVYAGTRKLYASQKQILIGVDAKIPLYSNNDEENALNNMQNTLQSHQANYQFIKDKEILQNSIFKIKEGQSYIRFEQDKLIEIKQYLDELEVILNSGFSTYAHVDFRTKQKAIRDYLNTYSGIQKKRISIYKEMVSLVYLLQVRSLEEVVNLGYLR